MSTRFFDPQRWLGRAGLCLGLGLSLLAGAAQAQQDAPGRVGRIGDAQGTVWMLDRQENEWVAAQRNRPVTEGDRLATDAGGRLELQVGSTTLRLDGQTEIQLRELDDSRVVVGLERGTLALRVRSNEVAPEFQVQTEAGRVLPQTAGHYRVEVDAPSSVVGVWAGAVRFDAPDSALDVRAGQQAEFWRQGGVTHYTWTSPERDAFSDWVLAQDRADEQRLASLDRNVSREMTGVDDLGRYGRWDTHPEYGAIWAPTAVAPGWAPYRNGRWVYMSPWGWTWVDDAPWGFAPFHYGRWVQWGGRWCWAPGQYVARPVYAPALVAWVGGSNVSVGVTVGGPPYVGWVPLAPRERYVPDFRYAPRWREYYEPYYGPGHRPPTGWRAPDRVPGTPFVNERLPGGITVVPSDVLRQRERISDRVIADPGRSREFWENRRGDSFRPPPPANNLLPRQGNERPPTRVIDTGNGGRDGGAFPGRDGREARPWPGRGIDSDGFHGRDNNPPVTTLPRDGDGNGRDDRLDRQDRERADRDRIDRERLERSRGNDRDGNGVPDHWRSEQPLGGLRNRDGSPANVYVRPQPAQPVQPAQPMQPAPAVQAVPPGQARILPSPDARAPRALEAPAMRAPEPRAMPQPAPQAAPQPRPEGPRGMPMLPTMRDKSGAERGGERGGERGERGGARQNER